MIPNRPDQVRPSLHFTAPGNWLNDPNGLIEHNGRFHLFYQHNPAAPVWGRPHWGHASSRDLLAWEHHPIALTPSDWFDEAGCYSGCTVIDDDGTPTILYTGVSQGPDGLLERVILATGSDDMLTWTKHPHPVIDGPPPGLALDGFRDPFVWREADGQWGLLLGAGHRGEGMVLLYRSRDLRSWNYVGVLLHQSDIASALTQAGLWECPQLVRLADSDVLLLSVHRGAPHHVAALEGAMAGDRFHVDRTTLLDLGPSFYAPHAFTTNIGDALVLGWLRDSTPARSPTWVGAISLPRRIQSNAGGAMKQYLAVDLELSPAGAIPTRTSPGVLTYLLPDRPSTLEVDLLATSTSLNLEIGWSDDVSDVASITVDTWPDSSRDEAGEEAQAFQATVVVDPPIVEIFTRSGEVASALLPRGTQWPSPRLSLTIRGDAVRLRSQTTDGSPAQGSIAVILPSRTGDDHA